MEDNALTNEFSVGPLFVEGDSVNARLAQIVDVPSRPVRLKAGTRWMNQKVQFLTNLFGKEYYWMQDGDGTVYLAKVGKNGLPDLS